jgi:hypothetical protein
MPETRVNCNISSKYHARLMRLWASSTGTPFSALGAQLLLRGLEQAIAEGVVPVPVLERVNHEFFDDFT